MSSALTLRSASERPDVGEADPLARAVLDSLSPVGLALGGLYIVLAPAHLVVLDEPIAATMAATALVSGLACLALGLHWRIYPPDQLRARPLLALLLGIALGNSAFHMALDPDPHQTTNFALIAIGSGCLVLSHRWLASLLTVNALCWAWLASFAPPAADWGHFLAFLLMANGLAVAIHLVRLWNLKGLADAAAESRGAEAALRAQQEQLHHAARLGTLGELAAALAHELRQPLAAIVNYARGCSRRLDAPPPIDVPALQEAQDEICQQAERASEILGALWSFARKGEPKREWVDLDHVVRDVLRLVEAEMHEHDVLVRWQADAAGTWVHADAIQVTQVLVNLVRNGIEAVAESPGGERALSIETRIAGAGSVEVAVRDTGAGLAADLREQLFEPFTTTKPHGLGLGLSISRRIVEAQGGTIGVEPNQGGGSVFRFTLPGRQGGPAHGP